MTALYTLPSADLPRQALDFKKRCKDELRVLSVKATRKTILFSDETLPQEETPWVRACIMRDQLANTGELDNSSVRTAGIIVYIVL